MPPESNLAIHLFSTHPLPGLAEMVEVFFPHHPLHQKPFELVDWFALSQARDLLGCIVDTQSLSLTDLRAIEAGLSNHPAQPWCILLVGDRGLVGFESICQLPNLRLLPHPWTPAGLQQVVQSLAPQQKTPALSQDAFLEGLVETLRDPLTSISGYLQLLESQNEEQLQGLIHPALEATQQIGTQLEFLQLATADIYAHIAPVNLKNLASEIADAALEQNLVLELDLQPKLFVDADIRFLKAAVQCAILLLQRFGPGGPIRIQTNQENGKTSLGCSMQTPQDLPPHPMAPPAYLQQLFLRLAEKASAEVQLEHLEGVIPVRLTLSWPTA